VNILFLAPAAPAPADQGARLRTLALLEAAAAHHAVDLLAFDDVSSSEFRVPSSQPQTRKLETRNSKLETLCRRVELVRAPGPRALLHRAWSLLMEPLPDLAYRLDSPPFRAALADLLRERRYDVIQIEGLEMMPFLATARAEAAGAALVYDAHNAEMSLQRTIFQTEAREPRHWHGALYSFVQWSRLGTYERVMMNATDMVLAVSEGDAAKLRGRHVTPRLVPNGVDTSAVPYREPPAATGRSLLFVGPRAYRPNADAVSWFVRRVLPVVRARSPGIQLRLVGRGTERVRVEGVTPLGYVQDMASEWALADALVVPMRMGGGVRFKVLEAMAAGVPVVSTPMGLAGIAAEDGTHALVAASPTDFAAAVVRVLEDRALARRLASNARRLVESRYDWKRITPAYLRLLTEARRLTRRRSPGGSP
jgi:glycosyltransferase involved in cell wall biosynthesis